MLDNHLKIEFGKYINSITEEIPADHIMIEESGSISRSVEPGEPNVPTTETFSFAIANLDPEGNQRYPFTWWENQARSQAAGAIQPLQIYFKITVAGGSQFLGMMKKLSYGSDYGTCNIELGDILEIVRSGKKKMLASFEFETRCISKRTTGQSGAAFFGGNDLDDAKSIDAVNISHASLVFELDRSAGNATALSSDIAVHLGWDDLDFSDYRESVRSAWVQIEDITLLTHVRIFQRNITGGDNVLYIEVWHNDEDSITVGSGGDATELIPRGQFLDRAGEKLVWQENPNDQVTLTLHEPNLGNGTPAAIHIDDTDLDQNFIFGVPYTEETGYIQITSAAYAYFDVVDLVTGAVKSEIDLYHSDSGESFLNFFDTDRVTSLHRKAFWSDVIMTGLAENTLGEALTAIASQTSSWMYTDRFGNVVIHSRNYSDDVLSGSAYSKPVLDEDWEWIGNNRIRYDNGFSTFEAEIPKDIIEINNITSKDSKKIWSDPTGLVSQPALRNKSVKLSNFRINDLGVPIQSNPYGLPVLRYSPDDANWPHADLLENFLPTPQTQLRLIAESFSWPTAMSRIKLPIDYSNLVVSENPIGLHYLIDENYQIWWVREEVVDPESLTVECDIQLKGIFVSGGSGSGSAGGSA